MSFSPKNSWLIEGCIEHNWQLHEILKQGMIPQSEDSILVTLFVWQLSSVKYSTCPATVPQCLIHPGHSRLSVWQPVVHHCPLSAIEFLLVRTTQLRVHFKGPLGRRKWVGGGCISPPIVFIECIFAAWLRNVPSCHSGYCWHALIPDTKWCLFFRPTIMLHAVTVASKCIKMQSFY